MISFSILLLLLCLLFEPSVGQREVDDWSSVDNLPTTEQLERDLRQTESIYCRKFGTSSIHVHPLPLLHR